MHVTGLIDEVHVSFINLSFGWPAFDNSLAPILAAIKKAHDWGIVIFAATGNYSSSVNTAWPASLGNHLAVLPVYSSDGHGNPSDFNPTTNNASRNICSLGEGIDILRSKPSEPSQEGFQTARRSGAAFSTAAVTGIAAIVYGFFEELPRQKPGPGRLHSVCERLSGCHGHRARHGDGAEGDLHGPGRQKIGGGGLRRALVLLRRPRGRGDILNRA